MFNHKIRQILTEELLREAASLDKIISALAKNNHGQSGWLELGHLIMADPTSVINDRGKFVGKYWKWIYNQYKQGNIHEGDIPELQAALNTYNINKSQINKPIDSYKSLDELVGEITQYDDSFKAKRTLSKGEQELEKVYEDQYVTVYIPHTWKAARKIGGDTKWCTASSSDHYFNYYLNQYGGEYYDIIRKSDGAKFQLHVESNQFMNAKDNSVNFACIFSTKKECEGLIRFLKSRGKDIEEWKPRVWFDEVEILSLQHPSHPEKVFDHNFGSSDGMVAVGLNGKYNFVNKKGELASPNLWFSDCRDFSEGVAPVEINGKWNYIGKDGKILCPDQWFDNAYVFIGGFGRVENNDKYNFVNSKGKVIFNNWYFYLSHFGGGFAKVTIGNEKWNYIDPNEKILSPDQWFDYVGDFHDGFGVVEIKKSWYNITRDGVLHPRK